jgi:hypothetical protein
MHGFRFVYILQVEDEDDFAEFRLDLHNHSDFKSTWEDPDYPLFGLSTSGLALTVHYYDPDDPPYETCLPLYVTRQDPFIYITEAFINRAVSMRRLTSSLERHQKLLSLIENAFPSRKASLHMEGCYV